MTPPLRLSPITPPPVPSFVRARPGTLSGSAAVRESPGFSLDLARVNPGRSSDRASSPLVDRLADSFANHVKDVDAMQTQANSMMPVPRASASKTEVLTAAQKADLAFHLLMEIRNKLMDAYREVQQIQI